ncbi:NAD(P)-binding domain-containing protein [Streptomyces sp. NPDC005963]|uniref:NADPH-dependent F420 reductase n=1 Tax=Streptomyces sp. NPDC005963 TaxID=3156721 RepID=UPI00340219C3
MTTIAVLGSGAVAQTLTGGLQHIGHRLLVGARDPQRVRFEECRDLRATGLREAAGSAEVVVNTLPGIVSVEVLTALGAELAGKVLIDVANAVESDARGFASAVRYPGGSLAEEIQRALPEARVVKTLNTVHVSLMSRPAQASIPPSAFLSGDDAEAKRIAAELLGDLGWPPEWIIDLGGVKTARGPESFVLMIGDLVRALGPVPFGMAIAR